MKKLLLIILITPLFAISQSKQVIDTVNTDQLEFKEDLRYKIDTSEPFTGVWKGRDKYRRFEYHYVDGLEDGLSTVWYRNGQKEYEEYYKKGERDGLKINWNSKGQKSSEIHYVNGRKNLSKSFSNDTIWRITEYSTLSFPELEIKRTNFYKNGLKRLERIYDKDGSTASEMTWYNDESKKEEKIYVGDKLNHKIWDHNGNELIPETLFPKDTIDSKEIEWINYDTAHKKGNSKPFTGVVTFEGELNYSNKRRGWIIPNSNYFSAATFVFGKINGPYTLWSNKNNQKIKEMASLKGKHGYITFEGDYTSWHDNAQMATISSFKDGKKDGESTTWYENGQISSNGSFINGERMGKMTIWYKNGQITREGSYRYGKRSGKFIVWDEDGKKSFEPTYYNGKIIKTIERDVNGKIIKELPAKDEDTYGLKIIVNEIVSILKSKNYDALKNLIISKEDFINIELWDNEKEHSNEVKRLNEGWSEYVSESIDKTKKERAGKRFENRTVSTILYDYHLINEDKTRNNIKWPKSINYDLTKAVLVTADITILLDPYSSFKIKMYLSYINNTWCFINIGRPLVEVE